MNVNVGDKVVRITGDGLVFVDEVEGQGNGTVHTRNHPLMRKTSCRVYQENRVVRMMYIDQHIRELLTEQRELYQSLPEID